MSAYPLPPPGYDATGSSASKKPADQEPLLGGDASRPKSPDPVKRSTASGGRGMPRNPAWMEDDGEAGGIPGGFEGMTVSQSSIEIRQAFIRKVYSILFLQIAATALVGACLRTDGARFFILQHTWVMFVPLLGALVSMLFLYAKRHSSPANLILLALFTVLEAMGVGGAVAFVETTVVLEALCLTALVFIGLTLFTFQTKRDFSGMGPYLGSALLVLFATSFIGIFFPFSRTMDTIYAGVGTLVFSLYIVFDTQQICRNLSPDDWVVACVSLYLDAVNLFLMILRLLSNDDR